MNDFVSNTTETNLSQFGYNYGQIIMLIALLLLVIVYLADKIYSKIKKRKINKYSYN